jgi:CDP-6-deoxy-D-xylo-4-hexulose-3-dehydrase
MIKLVSDTIDRADINALIEWLSKEEIPILTKNKLTVELEKKWADKIGTKYSVFVNSGSSAILLMLLSLKQGNFLRNNKIVCPALSWATDVSTPIILGFDTILCDCNLTDLSCDLTELEKIFKEENPSCFISVAPLGLVPEMEKLISLCEKYNVLLLEDICESLGSKYNGKHLGSFGFASVFSTYFGHHISTIEGGFINTNDEQLYNMLVMTRSHGWDRDLNETNKEELRKKYNVSRFDALYTFYVPGLNLRSTDLQAFIGLRSLDKIDKFSNIRNTNFKLYKSKIKNNNLDLQVQNDSFVSNFAYPIVSEKRDVIVNELIKNGVEVRPLIAGNMANKPFWYERYDRKEFKNANVIDRYGFYVPNHQDMTNEDIEYICKIINLQYE